MQTDLEMIIERARKAANNPEEIEAQRISFAYGNAGLENPRLTRDHFVRASKEIRRESEENVADTTDKDKS